MFNHFKTRITNEAEIMDDLSMEGKELSDALDQLTAVNRFLGGHQIVLNGLKKTVKQLQENENNFDSNSNSNTPIKIADLGCGGGDTLRAIADWGKKNNLPLQLYGIDANAFTIKYAQKHSSSYANIQYLQKNIFAEDCNFKEYDIVICSLFLHHFNEEELLNFLQKCKDSHIKALLVNDLQRHWIPYYLFKLVCAVFRASKMTREDGLLSIRRAFTRTELDTLLKKSDIKDRQLQWKWAFRYQLICFFNPV